MTDFLSRAVASTGAPPTGPDSARPTSDFTTLSREVHDAGLMHRRYAYYWAKLIGAVAVLSGWVLAFVWIGDSWWQLGSAVVLSVLLTQTCQCCSPRPRFWATTPPTARSSSQVSGTTGSA